jgi:hypothetical protein
MDSPISSPSPQAPLLDYHQLETFVVIGVVDYLDLLGDVIEDVPVQLGQIQAAIEQGDMVHLKARAHALRGLVAYFGCVAMTARLADLERQDNILPGQAAATHAELQDLWHQSLAALRAWEKSLPDFTA